LYPSANTILYYQLKEMVGSYSTHALIIYAHKIVFGKSEVKQRLGRPKCILILSVLNCQGVDIIKIIQDRVQWMAFVKTVMKLRAP
jgi:hypothetical protein